MDDFRKKQKSVCGDGTASKRGKYGCSCCRCISNLNKFKKWSRRQARTNLKQSDQKEE